MPSPVQATMELNLRIQIVEGKQHMTGRKRAQKQHQKKAFHFEFSQAVYVSSKQKWHRQPGLSLASQTEINRNSFIKDIGKISVHIGAAEPREKQAIGPGLVHVRQVTYDPVSEEMELNMLPGRPQLGATGISWKCSPVHRPQMCSTGTQGHKPRQIQGSIQMVPKKHWTFQGRSLHIT